MSELQTYREFRPTGFDQSGAFLDSDRQNWLVAPCSINRDSDALARSNWEQQLAALPADELDDESITWERHSFNHWACGWFEIVICKPGTEAARICEQLAERLEDYPVLDEGDYSRIEHDEFLESWSNWAHGDFVRECQRVFGLSDSAADTLLDGSDECLEFWMQTAREPYSGDSIDFREIEWHDEFSRDAIARLLLKIRSSVPA